MFAVCFGLQLLGRTLGVDVIHDPDNREVGTYTVDVSESAHSCEVFGQLPAQILVQQGHNDRITGLPDGMIKLASNDNTPIQAMRVAGKPIWATQFHPELTSEDNKTRYLRYITAYGGLPDDPADDPVLASLRPTPYSTDLLRRFAELVCSGQV